MEYKAKYDCYHYFGQMVVEADSEEKAKKLVAKKLKEKHPGQWDSCPKVNATCNKQCKLKIII